MFSVKRVAVLLVPLLVFLSVGLWSGILVSPQKFESLDLADASVGAIEGGWLVTIRVGNIGTIDAALGRVTVNGTDICKDGNLTNIYDSVIPVKSEAFVWVKMSNPPYHRGTMATITISTTNGNRYSQVVMIPEFVFE